MRIESSVTSVSWIPSEAITGPTGRAMFGSGIGHYDDPPEDVVDAPIAGTLDQWRKGDRFRFANHLAASAEFEGSRVVGARYIGRGMIGSTTLNFGPKAVTFIALSMPDVCEEPVVGDGWVRFTQTTGGRTGVPAPRRVNRPPFMQYRAPLCWTTLSLTIHADGRVEHDLTGASTFPRHWVYDAEGKLVAKVGLSDYKTWWRTSFGRHTPWGDTNTAALVTAVESALERDLATRIMRGDEKPQVRKVAKGKLLTEQGAPGDEVYLLLNGVLTVEVDGEALAEVGPGAILGERAVLEGGVRTSTLRAATPCKVAVATATQLDREALADVSRGHRREDQRKARTSG